MGIPFQVSASGWDLAAGCLRGFSGTADNRQVLPLGVCQYEPESLKHTDGYALRCLLDPDMSGPAPVVGLEATAAQAILRELLLSSASRWPVSVLIDSGAFLTGLSNRAVAEACLGIQELAFRAVIYFGEDGKIWVLDRQGRQFLLAKSPLQPADQGVFTYLDDQHTLGTDLRFRREAVGAVTVSRKMTKDRLMQATMRMRSLGKGQTVVLFLNGEARRQVAQDAGLPEEQDIRTDLLLFWVASNTAQQLQTSVVLWALQGASFAVREPFVQHISKGAFGSGTAPAGIEKLCLEPEAFALSAYSQQLAPQPACEDIPKRAKAVLAATFTMAGLRGDKVEGLMQQAKNTIDKQLAYLTNNGLLLQDTVAVSSMDEEQEREREQEKEREREVEVEQEVCQEDPEPQPFQPLKEHVWDFSKVLERDFVRRCSKRDVPGYPTLHTVTAEVLEQHGLSLPPLRGLRRMPDDILVTQNWLCSVAIDRRGTESAQCLRPVDVFLLFKQSTEEPYFPNFLPRGHPFCFSYEPGGAPSEEAVVLLSGMEASRLLPVLRRGLERQTRAHEVTALAVQLCHLHDPGVAMAVCPWGSPRDVSFRTRALLKLLNGDSGYWPEERSELGKFLGILEPQTLQGHVDVCSSERASREVWDALRDKDVLSWNGFVKRLLMPSDFLHDVDVLPRDSELQVHNLLKGLCMHGEGMSNPKKCVEDLVKLRLQIASYRGSSLENLLLS